MKSKQILNAVLALSSILFSAQNAFCWGDMGHQLVGAIAEDAMGADAKSLVRSILGIEPLAVAATWPDHVRDDDRFGHKDAGGSDNDDHDFAPYHFCEIPTGYTYETRPNKVKKDCYGVVAHSLTLIKDANAPREEKIIALRYLIHVTGDVHQPLHVGNGYDRGGNACQVIWKSGEKSTGTRKNLHSFWDDEMVTQVQEALATTDSRDLTKKNVPRYYPEVTKALEQKHAELFGSVEAKNAAKKKYGSSDVTAWLEESLTIRENGLYPDDAGAMNGVPKGEEYKHRPYCNWYVDQEKDKEPAPGSVFDASKIPTLTTEYTNRFEPIVEMQLLKGGVRLAALLDKAAADMKKQSLDKNFVDENQQEHILDDVQKVFENK